MCHPKQLISRVVVIVKDLKLQPQVLFMRTHLESDIEDTIKDFVVLFESEILTSLSLKRKSAQSGLRQFFLVSDFLST